MLHCCSWSWEHSGSLQMKAPGMLQSGTRWRKPVKKRVRKTLMTCRHHAGQEGQSTQLSSNDCLPLQLEGYSCTIPPWKYSLCFVWMQCYIAWPAHSGQIRPGVTRPLAYPGSANARWLKPGPLLTSICEGHLQEIESRVAHGMFSHFVLHDKQDLITAKLICYLRLILQLNCVLSERKTESVLFCPVIGLNTSL